MRLSRGARENHNRPAIDPLFRTAARYFGPRGIGVVLTGSLYDGTAGLMAIRSSGGVAVVQDPGDAPVAAMPQHASELAGHDYIARIEDMGPLLVRLVQERVEVVQSVEPMDPIERMQEIVEEDLAWQATNWRRGGVSILTCPECGGALWQVDEVGLIRYRCHVGHAFRGEVLLSEQSEALEAA